MGYKSNIRITLSINGFNELSRHVEDYLKSNGLDVRFNLLRSMHVVHESKGAIYFGWNNIKWYENSQDVIPIMSGLHKLEEKQYSYRYVRIGESYDDIDQRFNDGKKDENIELEYPSLTREFDDRYVFRSMDKTKDLNDKERM